VNRRLVQDAGFRVAAEELVTSEEDEQGGVTFQWILAQRE
jgi:hypothetical protein